MDSPHSLHTANPHRTLFACNHSSQKAVPCIRSGTAGAASAGCTFLKTYPALTSETAALPFPIYRHIGYTQSVMLFDGLARSLVGSHRGTIVASTIALAQEAT